MKMKNRCGAVLLGLALTGLGAPPGSAQEDPTEDPTESPPGSAADPPLDGAGSFDEEFSLEEEFLFEEEPAVYAVSKREQSSRTAPASVQVITAAEIARYGYRTVAEALRYVAGVFVDTDLQYDYIGIRGLALPGDYNTRVLVLLDGHSMNNPGDGSAVGEVLELDVEAIERIEVVRGPGSVMYGTSAFFGAVNIVTKKGAAMAGGKASLEAGRDNHRHARLSYGLRIEGGPEFTVSGSFRRTNGEKLDYAEFLDDFGTRTTSQDSLQTYDTYARAEWGEFSVHAFEGRWKTGIPTADFESNFDSPDSYILTRRRFVELGWHRDFKDGERLEARAYYDTFDWFDVYDYKPADPEFRDDIEAEWFGAETSLLLPLGESHTLRVGVEGQSVRSQNDAFERAAGGFFVSTRDDFSILKVYAEHEWQATEDLQFTGGLQYNAHSVFDEKLVGRLAGVASLSENDTLKLIAAQGFRNPSAYEAFFKDNDFIVANPGLESEDVLTLEATYDRLLGHDWHVSLGAYRTHVRNGILFAEADPASGMQAFSNSGDFQTTGLETRFAGRVGKNIRTQVTFSYQSDGGDDPANFPSYLAGLNLSVPLLETPATLVVRNAYVGSRLDRRGRRTISDALVTDLLVRVEAWPWKPADLTLGVYNLFDDKLGRAAGDEVLPLDFGGTGQTWAARLTVRF